MDAITHLGRESLEQGSRSFAAAARLFPAETRDSASLLYAACRYFDDVIDGQDLGFFHDRAVTDSPEQRLRLLEEKTSLALRGESMEEPVFQAFQRVVQDHRIPQACVMDFLQGFRMDVQEHTYDTLDDTLQYSYHVAGVVGVMMAMVMGVRDADILDRACDLGIAFQLTNISRDVMDDLELGRCYLPAEWLDEFGLRHDTVNDPANRAAVARVVRRLVQTAEPYYASAIAGLSALPFRSAWAIATARGVYRDIGTKVSHRGADAWDTRVVTTRKRKLYLTARGCLRALHAVSIGRLRPLPSRAGLWTRPRHL